MTGGRPISLFIILAHNYLIVQTILLYKTTQIKDTLWDYDDTNDWKVYYPQCEGFKQSPIALYTRKATEIQLIPLDFEYYNVPIKSPLVLHNNGHTVQVSIGKTLRNTKPLLSGGPLRSKYEAENIHFHWGSRDRKGSEHQIDGKFHDLEMHIVHRNTKYHNMNTARKHKDGLAVIAILFYIVDISDIFYPGFNVIFDNLKSVTYYNSSVQIKTLLKLNDLIDYIDITNYYTYTGSLTTPPCSESVTWIVFRDILAISPTQISFFWDINNMNNKRYVNVRKLQSSRFRRIFRAIPSIKVALKPQPSIHYDFSTPYGKRIFQFVKQNFFK